MANLMIILFGIGLAILTKWFFPLLDEEIREGDKIYRAWRKRK